MENETAGIANLVYVRILTSEDAGVGRWSERRLRDGVFEDRAALREAIKRGGVAFRIAVAAEVIRAQGIDGYDDQVDGAKLRRWTRGCVLVFRTAGDEKYNRQQA
jgi:hypothetical protein